MGFITNFLDKHPDVKNFIDKVMRDNVGMLASVVAWSVLTSVVPILIGLLALTGIILHGNASAQQSVESHLAQAFGNEFSPTEMQSLIKLTVRHTVLLTILGFLGILWGGSYVGGSFSTVFQPIFHTRGRNFFREKLIDVSMIFVFAVLMIIIVAGTIAVALLNRLLTSVHVPGLALFLVGTAISLVAGFLLFALIYLVFPHTKPRFRFGHVWRGAAIAAVLFQILSYIFPIYSSLTHLTRYSVVIGSLLVLAAWIYFFALILVIGAEFVAIPALQEARRNGVGIGPPSDDTVPQHAPFPPSDAARAGT